MASFTEHEQSNIDAANASDRTPVVFIHGLWLLPSSWDRWADVLRGGRLRAADAGLARRSGDGRRRPTRNPEVFADKTVGEVADHFGDVDRRS